MIVNSYWVLLVGAALQVSHVYAEECVDKFVPGAGQTPCSSSLELCGKPLYRKLMTENCAKTCGFCTPTTTPTTPTDKQSPIVDRKKGGGVKIISVSDSNIFFQGLNEVSGGKTAETEKSCLLEAQDAQEGWSFRLAVLDTPAKIQMVHDAHKTKIMNGGSMVGAKATRRKAGATTGGDPEHFTWSTGTPVDTKIWGKYNNNNEPDNYWKPEDYVYIDENAQLHDIHESAKFKPLCEYYKSSSIAGRKKGGGAKIISESLTNIYFQGLHKTNATDTVGQEKSCLLTAQDKAEGWSFRLAVLDTPAKMKMVKDALDNKILGFSQVGAFAPGLPAKTAKCKDNVSLQYFSWSTGTPVAKEAWAGHKGEPNNCNYNHEEKWAFIGDPGLLYDYYDGTEGTPLCEYYKNGLAERKTGEGAKIISTSDSNIFFQGLHDVSGGKTADTEKSCLLAAQDAREGWSFRIAVLDTPAKIQMVHDAYKTKVLSSGSYIGAKASGRKAGATTGGDPEHFSWSTGTSVDTKIWGKNGNADEPDNYWKPEDYVYIDENGQLHDVHESTKMKPLCEYYKSSPIVGRKKEGGAKIISESLTNIYFQGLHKTNATDTVGQEKSCLLTAQDKAEGWSFRLAVLDTPAKMKMVKDAMDNKILGFSQVGAFAPDLPANTAQCKDNVSPKYFSWSIETPVANEAWLKGEPNNCNYNHAEKWVFLSEPGQLKDYYEGTESAPLCEYYKNGLAERKTGAGAKIISATDSNIYFQGLKEVNGGQKAETEQSCLLAAEDAQEGWSFRIAVLDTPAKVEMVHDAYKTKVLNSRAYIGATAVGLPASTPYCKSGLDPEYFFWSTGAPVDRSNWGKDGTFDEPDNCHVNKEEYVFIDQNAKFHDVHKSANYKPLCEYYRA